MKFMLQLTPKKQYGILIDFLWRDGADNSSFYLWANRFFNIRGPISYGQFFMLTVS